MHSITKDTEDILDELNKSNEWELKSVTLPDNNVIKCIDILLYGTIDFNNENDIKLINKKHLINEEPYHLPITYSKFDYDDGIISSNEEGIFKWYPTYDQVKVLMLHHCYIGKPERVIIYRVKDVANPDLR